jgi:hypothetical protein
MEARVCKKHFTTGELVANTGSQPSDFDLLFPRAVPLKN